MPMYHDEAVRASKSSSIDCSHDGRTQQNFKESCNINAIVDKARRTGLITHTNQRPPQYADVTSIPDYQAAMDIVIQADRMFFSLDAKTRERFANDPAKMINFLQDNNNYDEALKLGLIEKKELPKEVIQKVEVINPTEKPSEKSVKKSD